MKSIALATVALLCAVTAPVLAQDPPKAPVLLNAGVGKDALGEFRETVFAPYDPVYCGALLEGASSHVLVHAVWKLVDEAGAETVVGDVKFLRKAGVCVFKLSPNPVWKAGNYKAELHVAGKLLHSLPYAVVVPTGTPTAETAKLRTAWTSLDAGGLRPVVEYGPGATFHCTAQLVDVPKDTPVEAVWTAVAAGKVPPNTEIKRSKTKAHNGEVQFNLSLPRPWPVGSYKVDVFVGGKLAGSVPFTVKALPPPAITGAATTSDPGGNKATKLYGPADPFYCFARFKDVTNDTQVVAVWIGVAAKGMKPNSVIRRTAVIGPAALFRFSLTLTTPWPEGSYKVDLYLEGEHIVSLPFKVAAPAPPQPAPPQVEPF